MENIDNLLIMTNSPFGSIRKIDYIIHSFPPDKQYDLQRYINHQNYLIELTRGNEERVFNDSRTHFRHGNRKTATMTDILIACYFTLYNSLIEKNIEININYDFNILLNLLLGITYNDIEDKLVMPLVEFEAIQLILNQFREKDNDLYNSKIEFITQLSTEINKIYDSLETWTYWNENLDRRTPELLYSKIPIQFRYVLRRGIWESHPSYINMPENILCNLNRIITNKKLDYILSLLHVPLSKECIDILAPPLLSTISAIMDDGVDMTSKKYLKYKNKYLKYKNKYLELVNKNK